MASLPDDATEKEVQVFYGSRAFSISTDRYLMAPNSEAVAKSTGASKTKKKISAGPFGTIASRENGKLVLKNQTCPTSCPSNTYCSEDAVVGTRGLCVPKEGAPLTEAALMKKKKDKGVKFVLYHGGLVGCPSTNQKCYIQYLNQVIKFVDERKIDRVFIILSMPVIKHNQFTFYEDPSFVAEHFLKPLNDLSHEVETGVVAYIRESDSNWDYQHTLADLNGTNWSKKWANPYALQLKGGNTNVQIGDSCEPVKNALKSRTEDGKPCPLNYAAQGTGLNQTFPSTCPDTCPDCSADCIQKCVNAYPEKFRLCDGTTNKPCADGASKDEDGLCVCKDPNVSKDHCKSKGGPQCPNIAYQVISYMRAVNKAYIEKYGKASESLLQFMSFDGEDAGSMASGRMICQLALAGKDPSIRHPKDKTDIKIGFAKAIQAAPIKPGGSFALPETYWFMNEMNTCLGDGDQNANNPDKWPHFYPKGCTTENSYRYFANRPQAFLEYLLRTNECGLDSFVSMRENVSKDTGTWPMFSLENLSGSRKSGVLDTDRTCLARHFVGKGGFEKGNGCGTFDGFSYWDWDRFMEFMLLFSDHFGAKTLGIYESQFIPPEWMKSGSFDSASDCASCAGGGHTPAPLPETIPKGAKFIPCGTFDSDAKWKNCALWGKNPYCSDFSSKSECTSQLGDKCKAACVSLSSVEGGKLSGAPPAPPAPPPGSGKCGVPNCKSCTGNHYCDMTCGPNGRKSCCEAGYAPDKKGKGCNKIPTMLLSRRNGARFLGR